MKDLVDDCALDHPVDHLGTLLRRVRVGQFLYSGHTFPDFHTVDDCHDLVFSRNGGDQYKSADAAEQGAGKT